MGLMHAYDLYGRLNRFSYIINYIIIAIVLVVSLAWTIRSFGGNDVAPISFVSLVVALVSGFYYAANIKERCNDISEKYWPLLLVGGILIPFFVVVLAFIPGNKTQNRYGSPPGSGFQRARIIFPPARVK